MGCMGCMADGGNGGKAGKAKKTLVPKCDRWSDDDDAKMDGWWKNMAASSGDGWWGKSWGNWKYDNDDEDDEDKPWKSNTGPMAMDANYEPPEEVKDKIPTRFYNKEDEKGLPDFWGGKTTFRWTPPCDKCEGYYLIAHALIPCDESGNIVNTNGAGARIAELQQHLDEAEAKRDHFKWLGRGQASSSSGAAAQKKTFSALKKEGQVMNICYKCYGKSCLLYTSPSPRD